MTTSSDDSASGNEPTPATRQKRLLKTSPLSAQPLHPWDHAKLPDGYTINENGVRTVAKQAGDAPAQPLTYQPAWVSCILRDHQGEGWSLELNWLNHDGQLKQRPIPMGQIVKLSPETVSQLANSGLTVCNPNGFRDYLLACGNLPHQVKARTVKRIGYAPLTLTDGSLALCYVRPDQTLYPDGLEAAEGVRLTEPSSAHLACHTRGTLDDWKTHIAAQTRGHPLPTFALCAALAGMLKEYAEVENAGFHFYGTSSRGKTIALQVACTVHGNGADPNLNAQAPTLLNAWNTTDNALESLAAAYADMILVMDELGTRTDGQAPIYAFLSGRGKARSQIDGRLQDRQTWNTLLLSSGEVSMQSHIETVGKREVKIGETIRVLDIPIDGLSPPGDDDQFQRLKNNCGRYYGTAGIVFVQSLLNGYEGRQENIRQAVKPAMESMLEFLVDHLSANGQPLLPHQRRALRAFAVVLMSGYTAVNEKILPHTEEEIDAAVVAVVNAWLTTQPGLSKEEEAIMRLYNYSLNHWDEMTDGDNPNDLRLFGDETFGVVYKDHLYLNDEQFARACNGLERNTVEQALIQASLLHRNDGQTKVRASTALHRFGLRGRCYQIRLIPLFQRYQQPADEDEPATDETDETDETKDYVDAAIDREMELMFEAEIEADIQRDFETKDYVDASRKSSTP